MNQINDYNETIFERIKHTNEYDKEYWYARELQVALLLQCKLENKS